MKRTLKYMAEQPIGNGSALFKSQMSGRVDMDAPIEDVYFANDGEFIFGMRLKNEKTA